MNIACSVGIAGAIVMATVGLGFGQLLLVLIAISCLFTCVSLRNQVKAAGPYAFEEEGEDYSASLWNEPPTPTKRKHLSKRAMKKAQKVARQADLEQARIDQILAKVSTHGMQSLTWMEKRTLRKATERQRRMETSSSSHGRKQAW